LKSATISAERKRKILQYVELTFLDAQDRQNSTIRELKGVTDGFVGIEHVLRDLDRFSRRNDSIADVKLIDVVRQTVVSLPKYPDIAVAIRIDPRLEGCPVVATDPFILRHVLQNLMVNAVESILTAGKHCGTISIRAIVHDEQAKAELDVQVEDDGIGIAPDQLESIFARGFSTKKGDRRGIGLHWCANAMLAIGGRVFAESQGAGRGATMHLIVPLSPSARKAA
jgi:signal transduction histidine kinase